MKITVITGQGGKIVGTAHHGSANKPEAGEGGPIAGPGQSVHVIDLPRELEGVEDASELHRRLKGHISSR
ncbi:MAG: hypothetical protein JO289_01545 [Xanthobacteraceae bacterium]|nr:hypothetical protein [Xanthobacteraceae bacterium]